MTTSPYAQAAGRALILVFALVLPACQGLPSGPAAGSRAQGQGWGEVRVLFVRLLPAVREPAGARFDGVDEAEVARLLASAEERLRARLDERGRLAASAGAAEANLELVLTGLGTRPASKTALDFIPLRLITGPIKDAVMGPPLEAVASFELRLRASGSGELLHASRHEIAGEGIGRADDADTRVTAASLAPALDRWSLRQAETLGLRTTACDTRCRAP